MPRTDLLSTRGTWGYPGAQVMTNDNGQPGMGPEGRDQHCPQQGHPQGLSHSATLCQGPGRTCFPLVPLLARIG